MTGFLLTAKQKLMLCINKRLYWSHWPNWRYGYRRNRSYWSHWSDRCYGCRCDWAYRSHRPDRRYWSYGSHGCNRPNR